MFHITQPLGIWSIMATFSGDVQYTQNGTFNNPCLGPALEVAGETPDAGGPNTSNAWCDYH